MSAAYYETTTLSGRRPGGFVRGVGWALLLVLLAGVVVFAATADRSAWPSLIGDEATYAMQAASLAFDGDLAYERGDYDRFVEQWGVRPDGLILQSRDDGLDITYAKSFLYAFAVAPAVRLSPTRGPLVANALMLALAALLAASVLERRVGPAAALWVAVACFASVTFAYAFWVHADLFLACCTMAGFALVYQGEPRAVVHSRAGDLYQPPRGAWESAGEWRPLLRWFAAGLLLAVPGANRPIYLALLLPALLAAREEAAEDRRGAASRWAVLLLAALLVVGGSALVQYAAGGGWSPYGGERQGFYATTGFPDVDFPRSEWFDSVRRWGNTSWFHEGAVTSKLDLLDAGLWGWNGVYALFGRDVGVLPYYLPLLFGVVAFVPWRGRWALLLAAVLAMAALFFVRPFNFYGGTGALADRYFLPVYPAFWFLAGRAPSTRDPGGWRRAAGALVVAAVAAPFLWPLWSAPRAFPIGADGRYRYVSATARRWLPYETTQSHIPGGRDKAVDGLWVKLVAAADLTPGGAWTLTGGASGREPAQILVGSPEPLERLYLAFGPLPLGAGTPAEPRIDGAEVERTVLAPDGGIGYLLRLDGPRAVHPMWWTPDDYFLYQLTITPPPGSIGVPFTLSRAASPDLRPSTAES